MLRSLKLDFDNKTISNEFIKGKDLIIQEVILALQCWTGDWFLDGGFGIPYDLRLNSKALLLADMQSVIMSVDGVLSVQDLDVKIKYENERKNRKTFHITGKLSLRENEEVVFNGLIPIVGVL